MGDITKTGHQSYRDLQKENDLTFNHSPYGDDLSMLQRARNRNMMESMSGSVRAVPYEEMAQYGNIGHSKYDIDKDIPITYLDNLEDWRGQNQSAAEQWLHGLTKGVGLAATTFLDGTLGLLYGVAQGIDEGRISAIWDNDLSNSLQDFNQKMEEWLHNYRTQEEQEGNFWQHAGTANFWADSFLKNLGFTVGAFYSGNAWLKGLQAMKWVKNAASAKVVGSLLSGFNEGRIEANNGQRDILNAQYKFIDDEREVMAQEIAANPHDSDEVKIQKLKTLDDNVKIQKDKTLERAHQAGMAILIGNTIMLTADNMWQFGKLYSRGFTNAKGIMGRIEDGMMKQGIRGGVKEGGKYVAETVSKPRAAAKGFSNAAFEGFEELNQAAIVEGAGYWRGVDSPDAYYKALKDPKAQLQTKGFFEALGTGLTNTYGNGDRWEEFAIGFLTGAIGMPTFGRVHNADANTWTVKNKRMGISGGIIGEYRSQMQQSRENEESAKVMNAYLDKLATNANYFSQSQSFTNAMDGFAAADNKFEYENASNNDDFAAINRFAKTGRLQDLKDMINQDFESMSDEQLDDIAKNTTPNIKINDDSTISYIDDNGNTATGGWRDPATGKLYSETPEGLEKMRTALQEKKEKILGEISKYEDAVTTTRAIGNNSLSEDQVSELAWYYWKTKMFEDRFSSIKGENTEFLRSLQNNIRDYIQKNTREVSDESLEERGRKEGETEEEYKARLKALQEERKKAVASDEEGETVIHNLKTVNEFIDALLGNNTALKFGSIIESNPGIMKLLEAVPEKAADEKMEDYLKKVKEAGVSLVFNPLLEELSGVDAQTYKDAIQAIYDAGKIAQTTKTFNERYKEFSEHPLKLIQNRGKIETKVREEFQKISDKVQKKKGDAVARRIDFSGTTASIAKTISENMDDINALGGIKKWMQNLPEEQQKKVTKVITFMKGMKGIKEIIEDSDDARLNDVVKGIASKIIDKATDGVTEFKEMKESIGKVLSEDTLDKEIKKVYKSLSDQELQGVIKDAKEAVKDLIDAEFDDLESAAREFEKIEEANRRKEKDVKGFTETEEEAPTAKEVPSDEGFKLKGFEGASVEEKMKVVHEANTSKPKTKIKESGRVDSATSVKMAKPQLSEYYLHGVDLESYYDYISKHPEEIPELTKYTKQQYLAYVKAVHGFLERENAFNYVKYQLRKDQEVEFVIDDALNAEAGVPVVLIRTTDGHYIGSMPSDMDFNSKPNGQDNLLKAIAKDKYDLYTSLVEQHNKGKEEAQEESQEETESPKPLFRTKIAKLMGGSPAWASKDSTVSEIFDRTGKTPVIGIVAENAQIKAMDSKIDAQVNSGILTGEFKQPGQLYLLTPSNNGSYVPSLLYSTPLSKLIQSKDDWYIQQIIKKLQEAPSKINEEGNIYGQELFKWLRANNLHVKAAYREKGKWIPDTSKNLTKATHLVINFGDKDKGTWRTVEIPIRNGEISEDAAYEGIVKIVNNAKDITTNVIIGEMNGPNKAEYLSHIANYLNTNVVRGQVHTINDFFTYDDRAGKNEENEPKKRTKKTTKTKGVTIDVSVDGQKYHVAQDNSSITRDNGEELEVGSEEYKKVMKAYMGDNPVTTQSTTETPVNPVNPISEDDLMSLLDSQSGETSDEEAKPNVAPKRRHRKQLSTEMTQESSASQKQLYENVDSIKKMFPQLSNDGRVVLVKGLINTVNEQGNPIKAYGEFVDGVLYISDQAPEGTAFHEAFHYITDMLMDANEREQMFKEAEVKYNSTDRMEVEERLAEDFRHYMLGMQDRSLKGAIKRFFERLKNVINSIRNNKSGLDSLFYNIYSNKYQNMTEQNEINAVASGENMESNNNDTFKEDLEDYRYRKTDYSKLDAETKEYLKLRKISEEEYQKLTADQRENVLHCL